MKNLRRYNRQERFSLAEAVAECGLRSVLRHFVRRKTIAFVAVVVVPRKSDIEVYRKAAESLLHETLPVSDILETCVRVVRDGEEANAKVTASSINSHERTIVLVPSENLLTERLELAADVVVAVSEPSARHFLAGAFRLGVPGLTMRDAEYLAGLDLDQVSFAIRKGRPVLNGVRRLKAMPRPEKVEIVAVRGPDLTALSGYGEVKEWGLQLAADFTEWREGRIAWTDVDRGALISGPPGCGKTTFAAALANSCGIELVTASAASWQAKGHLGDYLKAMRSTFDEARRKAPCVLFLDEFDSFGDRDANREDHNIDYKRQAINGLLEAIDGSSKLDGVVLIGATNYPQDVDAALLRPGRLERQLRVPMPDAEAREAILRQHLNGALPEGDLGPFVQATEGQTGAVIELVAKDARRRARLRRSVLEMSDIDAVLPARVKLSRCDMIRIAAHEVGHAIVGVLLEVDRLVEITIKDHVFTGVALQAPGTTVFTPNGRIFKTAAHYKDHICVLLSGTAAEELVFGDRADGSGGSEGSDLAMASEMAARLERRLGLGRGLPSPLPNAKGLSMNWPGAIPGSARRLRRSCGNRWKGRAPCSGITDASWMSSSKRWSTMEARRGRRAQDCPWSIA